MGSPKPHDVGITEPHFTYRLDYRDLDHRRAYQGTEDLPFGVEKDRRFFEALARLLVDAGAYDMKLHTTTTYHLVEDLGGAPPGERDLKEHDDEDR